MKHTLNTYIRVLLTLFTMFCISQEMWGDYYLWYNNKENDQNYSKTEYFGPSGAGSGPVSDVYTWTDIDLRQYDNYFYFSTTASTAGLQSLGEANCSSDVDYSAYFNGSSIGTCCGGESYTYVRISAKNACTVTVRLNTSSQKVEFIPACEEASNPSGISSGTTVTVEDGIATVVGSGILDYSSDTQGITECGVYWGTSEVGAVKYTATAGGSYNTEIGGVTLVDQTTYHYQAFATNCHGTGYGEWITYKYDLTPTYVPVVRIGKRIKQDYVKVGDEMVGTGDVSVSGYVAKIGCANVTSVSVYYANNSGFRNSGELKAVKQDFALASPITENNSVIPYQTLTAAQVSQIVSKGETLYVRIKVTNAEGSTSDYSDIVSLVNAYDQFDVNTPVEESVTACEGEHQFKFTGDGGMFNPAPDDWSVVESTSGDDAKSEFTLVGNDMVWTGVTKYNDGTHSGEHSYIFTAKKSGYANADATATLSLSAISLSATVTVTDKDDNPISSAISAEPWTLITLKAVRSDAPTTGVIWDAPADLLLNPSSSGGVVDIKGTTSSTTAYTITARAQNGTCGASPETKVQIYILNEEEPCTE